MSRHWHRKKRAQQDHADDWLMTYADMITLLLCFFVVFLFASLSLSHQKSSQQELPQTQKTQVALPSTYKGEETLPPDLVPRPEVQQPPPPPTFIGNLPFHDPSFEIEPAVSEPSQTVAAPSVPPVLTQQENNLPKTLPESSAPSPVSPPSPELSKSDKITVMEMDSSTFFESGSATLSPSGKDVLQDVLGKIKSEQFKEYSVTVEGHTDNSPIKTAVFPSNWELSTARASAVVHYFLEQGVAPQRLRAAGYADTFPKFPNLDEAGKPIPEHQAKNRRVVIKLERIEKG